MTIQVTIGKWYAVSGAAGSTVTTPDGSITLCTVPDGGQGYFNAPTTSVETSDDTVKVTQATFNYALAALGLLGGGVKINLMKYAHCTTVAEMIAVNADFQNDLTKDNRWVYLLPNLINGNRLMSDYNAGGNKKLTYWAVPLPKMTTANDAFSGCIQLKYFRSELPVLASGTGMFYGCRGFIEIRIDFPKLIFANLMFEYSSNLTSFKGRLPVLNNGDAMFYGTKLEIFDSDLPALTQGNNMFTSCKLNKESALRVLNSIPAYASGSHAITMGIHIDCQNDADVLAAIDNATDKGWTVTTQWNGTPTNTVSTFGVKRIWVRKTKDEQGEYVAQDGTRWRVDWCDMLSAPDGSTPEDHGYELYRSVDAAVAYWELEPYVDPEQEQLLTD